MATQALGNDHAIPSWFEHASLGMFVHWGISSVDASGELSWGMMREQPGPDSPEEYFNQAGRFNPDAYDPDEWILAAKNAGMEYAVLTTKHHDGFAMWPSEYGDFHTGEYIGGRDFVGEFVDACRRHGMKVGFYFSLTDWHHPSWPAVARSEVDELRSFTSRTRPVADTQELRRLEQYYSFTTGQIRELLCRYGQIDLLWFDTPDFFWGDSKTVESELSTSWHERNSLNSSSMDEARILTGVTTPPPKTNSQRINRVPPGNSVRRGESIGATLRMIRIEIYRGRLNESLRRHRVAETYSLMSDPMPAGNYP